MKPSWRIYFLIGVSAAVLHVSGWAACFVLVGYAAFEWLDQWLARKARWKEIEYEIEGWGPDPQDPEYETKGNLSRLRLRDKDAQVVGRITNFLVRIRY